MHLYHLYSNHNIFFFLQILHEIMYDNNSNGQFSLVSSSSCSALYEVYFHDLKIIFQTPISEQSNVELFRYLYRLIRSECLKL